MKDAEAHLLRMEDWMTTHNFPEDQKVGKFCLTLMGEARLWYATLNVLQQQLNWEAYKIDLGNNTPNLGTLEDNISMNGDLSNLMRQLTQ